MNELEEYINHIHSIAGPGVMHIIPNRPDYIEIMNRRPDLNLVVKGSFEETGINELVMQAIKNANKK